MIIIADDEPSLMEIFNFVLKPLDNDIRIVGDGESALSLFNENFDVVKIVVLDLNMPKLSGGRVYSTIRKTSNVPIVIMSGIDLSEFELGKDDNNLTLVQKPFNPFKLLETLRLILAR